MTKHIKQRKSKSRKQTGGSHHEPGNTVGSSSNMIVYLILGVLLAVVVGIVAYLILQTEKK